MVNDEPNAAPKNTPTEISLDELVSRVAAAADRMGKANPHRILLRNVCNALRALGHQLELAWQERDNLKAELDAEYRESRIILPGGRNVQ